MNPANPAPVTPPAPFPLPVMEFSPNNFTLGHIRPNGDRHGIAKMWLHDEKFAAWGHEIVRRCNAHESLVAALEAFIEAGCPTYVHHAGGSYSCCHKDNHHAPDCGLGNAYALARTALAHARPAQAECGISGITVKPVEGEEE